MRQPVPRTELPFMAGPLVTLGYCCPLSLPVDVFGEDIAGKQLCLQGQEHELAALPVSPTGNRKVRTRNDLSLKPRLRALFLPARPHLYNLQNNHSGDQCYKRDHAGNIPDSNCGTYLNVFPETFTIS